MNTSAIATPDRRPIHVAVAGWNAVPAMGLDPHGAIGGGLETFAFQLATALAARPHRHVSLLVRHTHRLPHVQWRGVFLETLVEPLRDVRLEVSKSIEKRATFPWLRVRRWRMSLLWQTPLLVADRMLRRGGGPHARLLAHCRKLSPQIWVALGCCHESAVMVRVASETRVPSVLWLQSNADLDPRFFAEDHFVNPYGVRALDARYAVQHASYVVCQTKWQLEQLRNLRQGSSVVIRNPVEAARWRVGDTARQDRTHVLWIGRFDRFHKRPLLCLEIARQLPDIPFVMVVHGGDAQVAQEVRATLPGNVRLVDRVPHEQMPREFARARLFLSTGSGAHEGFPNVLLEASAAGVPLVSLEDFDDFLVRSQAGKCGDGDLDKLVSAVRLLWDEPLSWQACASSGLDYVRREHDISAIAAEFDALLERLAETK